MFHRWTSVAAYGRGARRLLIVLLVAAGAGLGTAAAQEPVAAKADIDRLLSAFPDGISPQQVDAILAVADDGQIRAALRDRLVAEAAAHRAGTPAATAENMLQTYSRRLTEIAAAYPQLPQAVGDMLRNPSGQASPVNAWRLLGGLAFALAIGAGGMIGLRWLLAERRRRLIGGIGRGGARAFGRLALRLVFDAIEIGGFVLSAVIAYAILNPAHTAAPAILFILLRAAVIVLGIDKIVRFLCDPRARELRLIDIGDEAARGLHRAIVTAMLLTVIVVASLQILVALGLPRVDLAALALPLSVVPVAYQLFLIWRHRRPLTAALARWLRLEDEQAYLASTWLVVATVYLVGLWLTVADAILREQPAVGMKAIASLVLVLLVPFAAWLIHRPVARFYGLTSAAAPAPTAISDEYGDAIPVVTSPTPGQDVMAHGHVTRLMRAVWIVLVVLAVIVTARIWGFDPERHAGIGVFAIRLIFDVSIVLLIGYIGWALIVHSIDQILQRAQKEGKTTRAQRLATLLPLLRKFLQVVLLAIILMIILSAMGVDIGPLLAGAGVVGLAIGLGTQQTVADIVAGVFFLAEDAFRVGDYVEAGGLKGTVESISLRSLKLRHQRGAVHTLPFGQIKSLTNQTRDWSLMRLEFRVAPDTDIALVKRLVKEISKDFQADPEMGPSFLEPLKSQGIRGVEDGAITIGIKYITRPGQQFVIRREAYTRILAAFKDNGIELVGRGVVVKVEGPDPVTNAVAGAAAGEAVRGEAG